MKLLGTFLLGIAFTGFVLVGLSIYTQEPLPPIAAVAPMLFGLGAWTAGLLMSNNETEDKEQTT